MSEVINSVAALLDEAAHRAQAVEQCSVKTPFSVEQAYEIQRKSIDLRCQRGEQRVGIKLGFTSRAKMIQMGVDSLIWGWLTDKMVQEEGGQVAMSQYIHPRAEPELCFITKRDIDRPLNLLEVADYLEAVAPAIEIIDSRYKNFKFTLEDVVADNCSSSGLVVGPWSSKLEDWGQRGVLLEVNGRVVQAGSTAAILGHPLRSIVQASKVLHQSECVLPAGSLIMAGAATAAESFTAGQHIAVKISGLDGASYHAI